MNGMAGLLGLEVCVWLLADLLAWTLSQGSTVLPLVSYAVLVLEVEDLVHAAGISGTGNPLAMMTDAMLVNINKPNLLALSGPAHIFMTVSVVPPSKACLAALKVAGLTCLFVKVKWNFTVPGPLLEPTPPPPSSNSTSSLKEIPQGSMVITKIHLIYVRQSLKYISNKMTKAQSAWALQGLNGGLFSSYEHTSLRASPIHRFRIPVFPNARRFLLISVQPPTWDERNRRNGGKENAHFTIGSRTFGCDKRQGYKGTILVEPAKLKSWKIGRAGQQYRTFTDLPEISSSHHIGALRQL
ncbi:hypothetical protein B0T20DRAFT_395550 [Sordaria brevicollis]|uniref:Uncharacterized protein n=1 Tax=Sordaria brevicollis TaxID=83679 RepID=A0AAE0U991_SORBR|nr:hypothetical protein B0T20DRAFT_395550 [Sordaria brevicollis]